MPKRSSTDSQTTPSSSEQGDVDQKPSSSDNEDFKPDVSPSKKARKSPKKSSGEIKQTQNKWTADEDEVFVGLMEAHLKASFWQAVKDDGRLAYRGGNGVKAHVTAFLNKAKKSG